MKEALKEIEAQQILHAVHEGLEDVHQNRTHAIETLWDALDD